MTRLNKQDLRAIWQALSRLLPPGQLPKSAEELLVVSGLMTQVGIMITEYAPVMERGELVFSWRVPREHALTLNAYAYKKGWMKKKLRVELDRQIKELLPTFPLANLHGARLRRWVRATRFSTQRVDDLSLDVLGGKMPVDALVRCGVLADDNDAFAHREPIWEKTKRGNTHLLLEVFTLKEEGTHENDAVLDAEMTQAVWKPGEMTKWLKGERR
jgi:hypothetical protein